MNSRVWRRRTEERVKFFDQAASRWDASIPEGAQAPFFAEWWDSLGLRDGQRVLELGCGTGRLLQRLDEAVAEGVVVGVDHSLQMLRWASQRFGTMRLGPGLAQADALRLPLRDASVSLVVIADALPHLRPLRRTLAECWRVLARGGCLHVVHFAGRRQINRVHRSLGGLIKHDLLPPAGRLCRILESQGWKVESFQDEPTHYWVKAIKA